MTEYFPNFFMNKNYIKEIEINLNGLNTLESRDTLGRRQVMIESPNSGYYSFVLKVAGNIDQLKSLTGWLAGLYGRFEDFYICIPKISYSSNRNSYLSNIAVDAGNQTGKNIYVKDMTPSSHVLSTGDFIQFANSTKVYQLRDNLFSDQTGSGVLNLSTVVIESPADSSLVKVNEIYLRVALSDDNISYTYDNENNLEFDLSVSEVI